MEEKLDILLSFFCLILGVGLGWFEKFTLIDFDEGIERVKNILACISFVISIYIGVKTIIKKNKEKV
jgi:hypothetical protein